MKWIKDFLEDNGFFLFMTIACTILIWIMLIMCIGLTQALLNGTLGMGGCQ